MDFWSLMVKKDDIIISCVNKLRSAMTKKNRALRKQMRSIAPMGVGKEICVVLNAPSLQTQDLTALHGMDLMFVNRGFKHPDYTKLRPKYHAFVDSKMIKGIWPVTWIDEIVELSPEVTILLPLVWAANPMFTPYIEKGTKIYWLNWQLPFGNLGVSGACFSFAILQKYEKIYFTGFDATGIGHEMVKSSSHFYGDDKELEGKSTKQFVIDLLMHSRHLHDLNRLAEWCKKHGVELINLTNGGLLDMFPRENYPGLNKK